MDKIYSKPIKTGTLFFLSHSNHVPAALCTVRLQCFNAVFNALKYSCVLPNIIPTVKLICSNQRLIQNVQELLFL